MRIPILALLSTMAAVTLNAGDPALAGGISEDYDNFRVVGLYPAQPLSAVVVRVTYSYEWGAGPIYEGACTPVNPQSSLLFLGDGRFRIDFSEMPGGYRQSQAVLACRYPTYIGDDTADLGFELKSATSLAGTPVAKAPLCYTQYDDFNPDRIIKTNFLCGDISRDDLVLADDALQILQCAVGLGTCTPRRCDVDRSGSITIADAFHTLRFAVGVTDTMLCGGC